MIISPPLLKTAQGNQSDEDWLKDLMPFEAIGNYPISSLLAWHGGQHIKHNDAGSRGEPVRAIADGKVMFARKPSPLTGENAKPDLAINEGSDDGCVIIKHSTEIGEGPDGQVEYYSIYMHLKQVFVQKNQPVYRKTELGSVGQCNGENAMHMEIICDDANLKKLVGREEEDLDLSKDGRMDVVYGDMHFYIPAGAVFYAAQPSANSQTGTGTPAHTSTTPLFISMRFEKGNCKMSTRQENTEILGEYICIGNEIIETDYEYNLYKAATTLANRNEIAPSAMYELLRFGRVINIDNEIAIPAGAAPHWRRVNYPDGQGWVNLNAALIKKYSDADFPHWMGWNLIADDATPDSQCNSPTLLAWLDSDGDKKYTSRELVQVLGQDKITERLSSSICKFPTEWEVATLNTRYEWIKTESDLLETPLDPAQYENFIKLTTALCFWAEADLGITADHWHFHPKKFIEHFRKCGWLSENEMVYTLPKYLFYTEQGQTRTAITSPNSVFSLSKSTAVTRISRHRLYLNQCIRKYLGGNKQRISIFLAQVILETAQWRDLGGSRRLMHEWGFGQYNSANPATQYYTAFYGRGIMQLTWAGNYKQYGAYRMIPHNTRAYIERLTPTAPRISAASRHYSFNPSDGGVLELWHPKYDPDIIGENMFLSCDSGGFYWISKGFSEGININRVADRAYSCANVGFINKLVNGGGNGYYERQAYTAYLIRYLTDTSDLFGNGIEEIAPPSPKAKIKVNFSKVE
ncbi:peptidoglycan DD-metalloendopeptidase family protein [Iodobacter arcticus]|uniref:Peptidoglycan DD-metalloendopeptidase family protein n=1 Tax=Iodobacter arcticus TaxID=590593 RepID=A0ABW2QW35_9NEIS